MRERLKRAIARLKSPAFWLVVSFVAVLVVPGIVWDELDEDVRSRKLVWENRAKAEKPVFQVRRYQRYPGEFGEYYNDSFPFREYLVWCSNKLTGPLNNFFNPRVIIGRDGFMFSSDSILKYGDESADYTGKTLWNESRELAIVKRLDHTRRELAKMGIGFYVVIPPNKMAVYDDKLPEKRRFRKAPVNRAESLITCAARVAPELKICYLAETFRAARCKVKYPLFLREDTHWNSLGGYLAVWKLDEMINGHTELPPLESARIVKEAKVRGGDLRVILGGGTPTVTQKYTVQPPPEFRKVKPVERGDFHHREIHNPKARDRRRIWVYRDSFASEMEPYLGMLFGDVLLLWNVPLRRVHFQKARPDIVVLEIVERDLKLLDTFDFESRDGARMEYL